MAEEEDPTKFFEKLMGDVDEEQWETYKELKRIGEGLVHSDGSESEASADSDREMEEREAENKSPENLKEGILEDEGQLESDLWTSNLTVKYIDGEITFDEVAKIIQKTNDEEEETEQDWEKDSESNEQFKSFASADKFEQEFQRVKKRRKKRKVGHLPKDMQGLMGEANLTYARGNHLDAIKMCMEVIRVVPRASEPFHTLGIIYEDMGDLEKAFQFSLIGAFLNPSDTDEWLKLAQMSLEQDNIRLAITCYTQAINFNKTNINLHWDRCNLYEKVGDKKKALIGYECIVNLLGADQAEQCVQLCREVAKLHHENKNVLAAINILTKTSEKCGDYFSSEDVNMLLELQIESKMLLEALMCLRRHCKITFDSAFEALENPSVENYREAKECKAPEDIPIDLLAKLAVVLVELRCTHLIAQIIEPLHQVSLEEVGDLHLDLAESYMHVSHFLEAEDILGKLTQSVNFNLAAVWLRYAECLAHLDHLNAAVGAYRRVIQMAPLHFEARLTLSSILMGLGRTKEAIGALQQDKDSSFIDAKLAFELCKILYDQELWKEYVPAVKFLINCYCFPAESKFELEAVSCCVTVRRRKDNVSDLTLARSTPLPEIRNTDIDHLELWEMVLQIWDKFLELKQMEDLMIIFIRLMTCTVFYRHWDILKEIDFKAFLAAYFNKNGRLAYCMVKTHVPQKVSRVTDKIWNTFSQILSINQDMSHNRFCLRLLLKHPEHKALGIINGHTALLSGSYKHALGEYMYLYKEHLDEPIISLCIGVTFLHIACQKFTLNKDHLVVQCFAFLNNYKKLRGECQETYFNFGRASQTLGLNSFAIFYYKKALKFPPVIGEKKGTFDLSPEIAYNLAMIYNSAGARELAQHYLYTYCII